MTEQSTLRACEHDDVLYVAAADLAATLLDIAQAAEEQPALSAPAVLREIARGLAARPDGRQEPGQ